ncbi:hypothetical protein RHGRI_020907 [Rhododendron griersonianum]|uniref:Uncharacterized protein n=1 Tax=Rhododendron griersonianum TaxID=479676 RepID=A0AAV6JM06_9ERIC|nr:hypothetical protein RHGRI_020907 [Rhododendron griersonianum]
MVTKGFGFNDLVQSICNKWENLASSKFELLYAVADHHSCVLDNDEDFGCMIALAAAYGVNCIDVSVGIISSSVIECGKVWLDKMVNVVEVLSMVSVVVLLERKKIPLKNFVLIMRRRVFLRVGLI